MAIIGENWFASKWASELDKMYVQKSATGFMSDNVLRAKFVGAKTVVIPDVEFMGLVDYDRDNGFSNANMTVNNNSYTLSQDRARSITIDREDMDETGIANLAGQVLGEFVRTKVVPETDAYVLSTLAKLAMEDEVNKLVKWDETKPYQVFSEIISKAQDAVGFDEELVCFVDNTAYHALRNSEEFTRMLDVSDFKQGDINLKVKSIDGVSIIPVSSDRMMTNFTFVGSDTDDVNGGFSATADARCIRMLVLPKTAASLVRKTEKMRVFTPDQNIDADAYKFDYRIYYDVFVKNSNKGTIFASLQEVTAQE